MRIVIPGGSGQVGGLLSRALQHRGHEVIVLSRAPSAAPWRTVGWDARTFGPWTQELEGADAVINLAGRSVNCRYNARNRREILESRVDSTRVLGRAIAAAPHPPPVWLQASTATIYAHRLDGPNDEASGLIGGAEADAPTTWHFSIAVAKAWEAALVEAELPGTRRVALRSAMIMSPDPGGIFDTLVGLVRKGLGGAAAGGAQFMSWIHETDFVEALLWLIAHQEMQGAVNLAAPNPLRQGDFMRILRQACGARLGLPASKWMLSLGALLLQTETELILKSRRVVPGRLLSGGFRFQYPAWQEAAAELIQRWRQQRA